jgi:hypothetical protein
MIRRTTPLAALLIASIALLCDCSNQSEGQPCSRLAKNDGADDCEQGLTCQQVGRLQLCCPAPPATPTVPECVPGSNLPDAGADTASSVPDAGGEAEVEASPDADLGD